MGPFDLYIWFVYIFADTTTTTDKKSEEEDDEEMKSS